MHLLALLHIKALEWRLMIALAESDDPVSEASLALIIHANRTTIRPYIQRGILAGHIIREKSGIRLTENGQSFVEQIQRDLYRISTGRKAGFSLLVIRTLSRIKGLRKQDQKDLLHVQFPKPLRVDVSF